MSRISHGSGSRGDARPETSDGGLPSPSCRLPFPGFLLLFLLRAAAAPPVRQRRRGTSRAFGRFRRLLDFLADFLRGHDRMIVFLAEFQLRDLHALPAT